MEGGRSVAEKGFSAAFLVKYLYALWGEEDKSKVIVGIAQDVALLNILSFLEEPIDHWERSMQVVLVHSGDNGNHGEGVAEGLEKNVSEEVDRVSQDV